MMVIDAMKWSCMLLFVVYALLLLPACQFAV